MKLIHISYIVYESMPSVKVKFGINQTVEYSERSLTKLFNSNIRRIYDVIPEALYNPDRMYLEDAYSNKIKLEGDDL